MTPATSLNIETFLFDKGAWVSREFLMEFLGVSERELRRALAGVAVAGPRGYIHCHHAAKDELEAYCGPKWSHAVGELKNLKRLRLNHHNHRRPYPAVATVQPELI